MVSVSLMLASMDQKADKGSSSATTSKPKPLGAPDAHLLLMTRVFSPWTPKKREKKEMLATKAAAGAKKEALRDDSEAFTVVAHGKKYHLVGPNGMGKSTILKLLAWRKTSVPKTIDVLLVEQEVVGDDKSALEAVVQAAEELVRLCEEENNSEDDDGGEKLVELYERLQVIVADAAESQASKVLAGLGWRLRISLTRPLFDQPTLLLHDETANYLDLRAVLWLEEYLCRWKKTLVVVSRDRDFLKTVCNEIFIFMIRSFNLKAAKMAGNQAQQKKVKEQADFFFQSQPNLPHLSCKLIDVNFGYQNRDDFRLSNVGVGINMGTRVAIAGPNGAGKSTLLNLLAGYLILTEGEARKCQKLRIGRYSQHFVDLVTKQETPVQYLLRLNPEQGLRKQQAVRARLRKFGLPGRNHLQPIVKLSGGERLGYEPTNDVQSTDALADALDEFTGGVVLVSHDSRIISKVCEDEEIGENGTVESFPGIFDEYKEELQKEIKAEVDELFEVQVCLSQLYYVVLPYILWILRQIKCMHLMITYFCSKIGVIYLWGESSKTQLLSIGCLYTDNVEFKEMALLRST
ncbi:hypothetical protein MKW94_020129 [Papaver nudicaule]|uniref:ABC transporter domain-containing protein n=1 Tax=Papaver nudicaule TaxID=74823 RepID=A0AA41VGF6_PAPNU|nr:hypothetical protein [Papaver nudicaule]